MANRSIPLPRVSKSCAGRCDRCSRVWSHRRTITPGPSGTGWYTLQNAGWERACRPIPSGSRMRVSRIVGLAAVAAAILARPTVTPHSVIVEFNGESARSLSARYKAAVAEVQDAVYKTRKRYRRNLAQCLRNDVLAMSPVQTGGSWLRGKDLNLRPLGYEPNELPDCSTPQNYGNVPGRSRQFSPRRVVIPWRECESSCEKSTCMWVYSALPAWSSSA
jgi:hypothetical protein